MTPRRLTTLYIKALTATWILVIVPLTMGAYSCTAYQRHGVENNGHHRIDSSITGSTKTTDGEISTSRSDHGLLALDRGKSNGVWSNYRFNSEGRIKAVSADVRQGASSVFGFHVTDPCWWVCASSLRSKILLQPGTFVCWDSFSEHERQSRTDMETGTGSGMQHGTTKAFKKEGLGNQGEQSFPQRIGQNIWSFKANHIKGKGQSNLEGMYETTAYSFGCTMPRFGVEPVARRAANGRWPVADVTIAADPSIPFGTELLIEGLGFRTVGDRGSAIKGNRIDVFVDSCREAKAFGRQWLKVYPVPSGTTRQAGLEISNE